jgi:SurA N-terminal domain
LQRIALTGSSFASAWRKTSGVTRWAPFALLLLLTSACGSATARSRTDLVASVGGQDITAKELQSYAHYANAFYAAAYPGSSSRTACEQLQSGGRQCGSLREQVLARLLQERVVLQYADHHHISLSAADHTRVTAEMDALVSPGSYTADLYASSPTRRFLRRVLETQALILKVEQLVVGSQAQSGFAYHLQKFVFPAGNLGRTRATNLARSHHVVAGEASVETVWQAAFRLAPAVSLAASTAKRGDYLGPFPRSSSLLVVRLLGAGVRQYGRTAQVQRLTQLFRSWLVTQLKRQHPACYSRKDRAACDLAMMKLS